MADPYDEHARERWVAEPPKRAGRTEFERDRARVLHSASFRRLAGKTQVVVAGESDFPRTRLTHSLEVAQIGRELGASLGCDPDVVEVACLAHDLGHPPFGHNGEQALDEVARDCGGFEGNAQTLRVLTRLEAKTFAPGHSPRRGRSVGLNLARASLEAVCKYPWRRQVGPKFGVYDDDLEVFDWLRVGVADGRRCLEAQVMDWADDIAYSVHDVEDAVHAGHLRLAELDDAEDRRRVLAVAAERYVDDVDAMADRTVSDLDHALAELQAQPWWPVDFDGSLRSLAGLKNMTSELIGRFCQAADEATRQEQGPRPLSRYAADLVVPRRTRLECAVLKAVAAVFVMERHGAPGYATQRELVRELAGAVLARAPGSLGPELEPAFLTAHDDARRLRVVVDRVAGLTDLSASALYRRLAT
jgi:dGTPase